MGATREQKVIRALSGKPTIQKFTPIATDMFLPNHSGISTHPEMKKGFVPYTGANDDVDLGANNLNVGSTSTTTVDTPTNETATQTASGNFPDDGYYFSFKVYAYDSVKNVYSEALPITFSDSGTSTTTYDIELGWDAVAGATSYRVVIISDDYNGFYGDAYKDTATNSLTYDGITDWNSYDYVEYIPSPLSPVIVYNEGDITSNYLDVKAEITASRAVIGGLIQLNALGQMIVGVEEDFDYLIGAGGLNILSPDSATLNLQTTNGYGQNYVRLKDSVGECYFGTRSGGGFMQSQYGDFRIEAYGGGLGGAIASYWRGGHKSSDNSTGITVTISYLKSPSGSGTLTFKNGIITAAT
jgi:hypothetical protein